MTVIELTICFEDKTIQMPEAAAYNPFAKYLKSVAKMYANRYSAIILYILQKNKSWTNPELLNYV